MVGYRIDAFLLPLLCQVIQEEINEDGVDFRVRSELEDLAAEKLNCPYATA